MPAFLMALACGLMGIDVNEKEPLCPIAGAGVVFTGAPAGNVSPVFSAYVDDRRSGCH